jgi:hypothetical protein
MLKLYRRKTKCKLIIKVINLRNPDDIVDLNLDMKKAQENSNQIHDIIKEMANPDDDQEVYLHMRNKLN